MEWKEETKKLLWICGIFILFFFLPLGVKRFDQSIMEALHLAKWYAREHVILCLIPAFFIAGAVAVFITQSAVIKYFGAKANQILAYSVASVSGAILSVCSCTVLPLFSGIYRMGAGLGPAVAFLYSGPAINVLAIIMTARILGLDIGIARALGAIIFSVVIGIIMQLIFKNEKKSDQDINLPNDQPQRPLWQTALYFICMIAILILANWGKPDSTSSVWGFIYDSKWLFTSFFALLLGTILILWFKMSWWKIMVVSFAIVIARFLFPGYPLIPFSVGVIGLSYFMNTGSEELGDWFESSWGFAKQILPLLLLGVLFAGFFLGRVGHEGIIPSQWIAHSVGGNSLFANFFASFIGAFMYFATLTEVPILQGLIGNGMGKGPALALLLAGPALSLPNMLVIKSVLGTKKTIVFVGLVIIMATLSGLIFGSFYHE